MNKYKVMSERETITLVLREPCEKRGITRPIGYIYICEFVLKGIVAYVLLTMEECTSLNLPSSLLFTIEVYCGVTDSLTTVASESVRISNTLPPHSCL